MQHEDDDSDKAEGKNDTKSAEIIDLPSNKPHPRRFPFKFPRLAKLRDDAETMARIKALAELQCTQKEAAGGMCVSVRYFEQFLSDHPHMADAWWQGRQMGRVSLRRRLWEQSEDNANVAMFLAKDDRWLGMNKAQPQTVIDQRSINVYTDEDNKKRIAELLLLAKGKPLTDPGDSG